MRIVAEEDHEKNEKRYVVTVPNELFADINFDAFDLAVLQSPIEHASDALQSLQIIFFRHEQQHGSRRQEAERGQG
jgi:hypothetical protein